MSSIFPHISHYCAEDGCSVLLFVPISTKHTGEMVIDRTVIDQEWI